jgi:small subunit ribosomal protein S17
VSESEPTTTPPADEATPVTEAVETPATEAVAPVSEPVAAAPAPASPTPAVETGGRGRQKVLVGKVISVKMDKTAVVSVERREPHPLYRKIVRSTKHYKAHDPNNGAVLGDVVRIVESRPISKQKRWRIAATLVRGNVADLAPRDIGAPEEEAST